MTAKKGTLAISEVSGAGGVSVNNCLGVQDTPYFTPCAESCVSFLLTLFRKKTGCNGGNNTAPAANPS